VVDVVDEGIMLSGNVAGHGTLWHKKSYLCMEGKSGLLSRLPLFGRAA